MQGLRQVHFCHSPVVRFFRLRADEAADGLDGLADQVKAG